MWGTLHHLPPAWVISNMGYHKISADVKMAAIRIYEMDLMPLENILAIVNFSEQTWWHTLKCYRTTGNIKPPASNKSGQPRILVHNDVNYLLALVCHCPSWFLDELLGLLVTNHFISVHYTTIFWELECAEVSLKKLCIIAKEHSEDVCADFICWIAQYSATEIGFLDEFSKDERTLHCWCGCAKKGQHAAEQGAFVQGAFVQGRRVSGEGLLTVDGIVANTVVKALMTKEKFLHFLEHQVVSCNLFPCSSLSYLTNHFRCHWQNHIQEG